MTISHASVRHPLVSHLWRSWSDYEYRYAYHSAIGLAESLGARRARRTARRAALAELRRSGRAFDWNRVRHAIRAMTYE